MQIISWFGVVYIDVAMHISALVAGVVIVLEEGTKCGGTEREQRLFEIL